MARKLGPDGLIWFTPPPVRGRYLHGLWKDSPSPPQAPDPVATANAQGVANLDAARTTTKLNRFDQITPYGNLTWQQGGEGGQTFDQSGYETAMRQYEADLAAYNKPASIASDEGTQTLANLWGIGATPQGPAPSAPKEADFMRPGGDSDKWTSTTTLDPRVQGILDAQLETSKGMADASNNLLGSATSALSTPLDLSGLNARETVSATPTARYDTTPQRASLDLSGLPAMPVANDATRQRVEDALYQRAVARLDPAFQQRGSSLEAGLAAQGITQGSEAYNREQDNLSRSRNDAYSSAMNDAIAAGGAEQSRLFALEMAPRQQTVTERNLATGYESANAARDLQSQMFDGTLGLQTDNQNFQNQLAATGFNNSNRSQALAELLALRQQPLNELNALRTGAQVATPQFQGQGGGTNVAAAPVAQSAYNSYQGAMNGYNAEVGANNAMMGGLTSLGSAAIMSPWVPKLF